MTAKPYLIATPRVGLERDMEPEWLPNDAYPDIEDAYMFRGRIQRRRGFQFLGRLITTALGVDTLNLLPVMGLRTRELDTINEEQLIAFDTTKSNVFNNTTQLFQDITFHKTTGTAFSWTGSDSDFFWTVNYLNAFWATNDVIGFQANPTTTNPVLGDGIRWYDGTGWVNFLPQVDSTNFLMGALIIVSYRNRLVMLNTAEGTAFGASNNFPQRARWSQNGTPYQKIGAVDIVPAGYVGGGDANAWRSDIVGRGGFIDAPTGEQIISAEFYKDTLIVFFERSTWQLRYSGSELLPFIWERINIDFGAESTFSIVAFDDGIVAVGNYGIISCDATGVKRIDQIIPDEVFKIHNGNNGVKRVYGIRDYTQQLVYWTFPSEEENPTFPNRVLVYNYIDGSYSFFNDSFTCYGYYQPFNDTTWANLTVSWESYPQPWNNGDVQSDYPEIVAGNQQGFVFHRINAGPIINSDASLYMTNATQANPCVITSANHNLQEGQIIQISAVVGMTELNGNIYRISAPITANTFAIQTLDAVSGAWIFVDSTLFTPYVSGGLILVRNNFDITTKRFNPFLEMGSQTRMSYLDMLLGGTESCEFTANIYVNENSNTPTESYTVIPNTTTGEDKMWIRTYTQSIGQFLQIELTFSDAQIVNPAVSNADVVMHAMMPWFSPSGRLVFGNQI